MDQEKKLWSKYSVIFQFPLLYKQDLLTKNSTTVRNLLLNKFYNRKRNCWKKKIGKNFKQKKSDCLKYLAYPESCKCSKKDSKTCKDCQCTKRKEKCNINCNCSSKFCKNSNQSETEQVVEKKCNCKSKNENSAKDVFVQKIQNNFAFLVIVPVILIFVRIKINQPIFIGTMLANM